MHHIFSIKVIFRLVILCTLIVCLWSLSRPTSTSGLQQNPGQIEKEIPITIHQLQSENSLAVVDVRCKIVHRPTPRTQKGFTCVFKNNASKNITAANLIYSILVRNADGGEPTREPHFLTMETFTVPGFEEVSSPFRPGSEKVLGPIGIAYPDIVRGVEINIDYIEFEDRSILGPDKEGSKIVASIRKGAAKYKNLLIQEYVKRGKSVAAIIPLLQRDYSIPVDLDFSSSHEEGGAKQYRNLLRRRYQTLGAESIERHLEK